MFIQHCWTKGIIVHNVMSVLLGVDSKVYVLKKGLKTKTEKVSDYLSTPCELL